MENRTERGFPQHPYASLSSVKKWLRISGRSFTSGSRSRVASLASQRPCRSEPSTAHRGRPSRSCLTERDACGSSPQPERVGAERRGLTRARVAPEWKDVVAGQTNAHGHRMQIDASAAQALAKMFRMIRDAITFSPGRTTRPPLRRRSEQELKPSTRHTVRLHPPHHETMTLRA